MGGCWSGTLNEDAKLLASDGAEGDYFGLSVSISGDRVVAGAYRNDDYGVPTGSAYVFGRSPLGDVNCDCGIDNFDIDAFVLALTSANHEPPFDDYNAVYPDCNGMLADINEDGTVNNFDIDPFVDLLTP